MVGMSEEKGHRGASCQGNHLTSTEESPAELCNSIFTGKDGKEE